MAEVAGLVGDEVVDDFARGHHGEPVVLDGAVLTAVSPLALGAAEDDGLESVFNTEESRILDGLRDHVLLGLLQ